MNVDCSNTLLKEVYAHWMHIPLMGAICGFCEEKRRKLNKNEKNSKIC